MPLENNTISKDKDVHENYFRVLNYDIVLLFLCETDVLNSPLIHEF
jgi:hypothetical protein